MLFQIHKTEYTLSSEIGELPIKYLKLDQRTEKALVANGITKLKHFELCPVRRIPNLGYKRVRCIEEKLSNILKRDVVVE